ncbi:hypothetical protein Q3A66_06695 [Hymenobacter sp. BT770]|uniref:hypothetical protein n=1 Tax=Hymenobacter sp. BT770 TaxID=2886942 RepID=UPI001D1057A5|nr:hypothetical protein [Hymenobacter sp. BT770]MCC3152679.1 hypothetical protein [Hymenobacter sp. BT770]MDO3414752.1 hypothetical protein [Hymenobacter sp. BT770]
MNRRLRLCFPFTGLLVAVLLLLSYGAEAQVRPATGGDAPPPSTRRCRYVALTPGRDTTSFTLPDTLTVVPSSVVAGGRVVAYDARSDQYRWIRPAPRDSSGAPLPDSLLVCYRVLPLRLSAARFRRPLSLMDTLSFRREAMRFEDFSVKEQILSTPGINKTGNLARGISFGNTQNVFVNSALNLQLEGKLAENINLTAAISDQNVPFQPEGNTQQLQQFDKIYITLTNPNWNLTAGDVVLRNKPDYFLRYYKNIQGAAAEANFGPPIVGLAGLGAAPGVANAVYLNGQAGQVPSGQLNGPSPATLNPPAISQPQLTDPNRQEPSGAGAPLPLGDRAPATGAAVSSSGVRKGLVWQSSTSAAGGVAKGKFASTDVPPIENVQGPYRLNGPNGEQFIIVLANSERVYLDGRLQTRGFDADYTIDYNLAEVTFTPRHLITRNSRIKIDFEYSDLNYSRSLLAASHYQQVGRLSVRGNFYQEADNPNNAPNLNLTDSARAQLQRAGNVAFAVTPGGEPVAYTRTQVLYRRDTATGRYRRAVGPDTLGTVYSVRFTDVGQGNGDYRLTTTDVSANGRVYEFAGAGQGRYQPVRRIPTPLLKQMVSGGISYRVDSSTTVFFDAARSRLDRNRFSSESDQDGAMRMGYVVQDRQLPAALAGGLLRNYRLRSTLDYEYTGKHFSPIDRYRDIEFDRNWSATNPLQSTANGQTAREDNIFNFSVGVAKDVNNNVNYRLSRRFRPGEVSGLQHWLDAAQKVGNLELRGTLFVLNSDAGRFHSDWARGEATGRFVGGKIVPGYAYRFDKNRVRSAFTDTIRSANYFDEHNVFIQSRDSARTQFRLDYSYRRDQTPNREQTALQRRGTAQTWQGTMASRLGKTQDLRVLATYRDLDSLGLARNRTVLGQVFYNASLLQNQIRSELSYSVATGRELKRDFSYLAVPAGQGTHYYGGDANGNGQQEKDEFFEAQTPDAQYRTYIKVYLPTSDYITAFTNRLSYRLTTAAPRGWREAGGWRGVLARFATLSSITVDRRTTDPSLLSRLSPFSYDKEDAQLLAFNQLMRNTLYFNRSNPIFGAELTVQQTQQKTLLAQGFDRRNLSTQSLLVRRTLATSFTGRLTGTRDIREATSDYLLSRNYRLLIFTIQPEISYQPTPALRLTGTYLHTQKQNTLAGKDAELHPGIFDELGLETRLSQVNKRTITAATRYTRVQFDGTNPNSVVAVEILNALRPGSNFTWNLNVEQRLSNGLNITVAYDGRKANGLRTVHTGRMQVAVLF